MASILEALAEVHYLPDELPPIFGTSSLHNLKLHAFTKPLEKDKAKSPVTRGFHLDIPIGMARRRRLTVPNPKSHLTLCREIHDNWKAIEAEHAKSPYSVITPMIWDYQAIKDRLQHEDSKRERIVRSHQFSFLVQSDIQAFYDSIYTHSLAWAIHGKKTAKSNIGDLQMLGNRLDLAAQRTQDGQTNGLPTSPKTSLILAELIGKALDVEIKKRLDKDGIDLFGQRAVDDFKFYVRTAEDAERTLAVIQAVAAEYHLRLNADKTLIQRLPEAFNASWVGNLRLLAKGLQTDSGLNSIVDYFNAGFELAHKFPNDSVLRFMVARLLEQETSIAKGDWPVVESLLLKTAGSDGRAAELVHKLLRLYKSKKLPVDETRVGEAACAIVEYALSRQNDFEAIWGLYMLLAWKRPLSEAGLKRLEKARHPLLILLGCALAQRKQIPRPLDTSDWQLTLHQETLDGEYWMVLYEVSTRKWFTIPDPVPSDPFYAELRKAGVYFLKI